MHYLIVSEGANANGVDRFDHKPLTLVSASWALHIMEQIGLVEHQAGLYGHFEVVQLLLESEASCARDTFQGEW